MDGECAEASSGRKFLRGKLSSEFYGWKYTVMQGVSSVKKANISPVEVQYEVLVLSAQLHLPWELMAGIQ